MFFVMFRVLLVVPDGEVRAPGELGVKFGELIGYVKFVAFGVLVLCLIGVALELARARSSGSVFEGGVGLVRVLVAAAIVSGASSLIGLLV